MNETIDSTTITASMAPVTWVLREAELPADHVLHYDGHGVITLDSHLSDDHKMQLVKAFGVDLFQQMLEMAPPSSIGMTHTEAYLLRLHNERVYLADVAPYV